jgi:hypothetical protein
LLLTVHTNEQQSTFVETVLQKINTNANEQTETPNNQQSGVLPLNIEMIQKYVTANPAGTRWNGKYDQTYFGIAVVLIPKTDLKKDIRPMLRNRAILLATNEAAFCKAVEKYAGENGTLFTNAMLFKQALLKTFSGYQFNGEYQKTAEFVFEENGMIIGVVAVLGENMNVTLEAKPENKLLKNYLDLLQQKIAPEEQSENILLKEYIHLLEQKL